MALTPNYLQKCTDGIERQYQQLVTEILVDLADRISHAKGMTSTAEYLNEKLQEMSLHQVWINQMLAKVLNTTEKEVEKLMEESTYKSTRSEIKNLEAHGYDTSGLEFAAQIEKSTNVAKNELTNLTRTTGQLATAKLMNIYDQAYLQVSTGAYSYDQAVTNAVKKLAKDGLGEVTYPTGAKRTVEAAVRVAVRTSVSQNALKCEEDMLDDMDVNLVEVSSHLGARPSHAVWQGKIYWRKHPEGNYENFYEATGYGTPTGLGGYNCRHQHYAYFGDDDEQTYHHIDETLNKEAYEMEQKQRSLERKLREWDRKEKILNAGGIDSTEAKRWKSYYKKKLDEHVKSSNGFLKRDYAAEKAWSGTKPTIIESQIPVKIPRLDHKIDLSDYDLTKLSKHQDKHRIGTQTYYQYRERYGPTSMVMLNDAKILDLIQRYSGTGRNVYSRKGWEKKEVILDSDTHIGYNFDTETKQYQPTNCFMIIYSKKKGVHIRPVAPGGRKP